MSRNDLVAVSVEYLRQTELAIQVKDGDKKVWIPKSQVAEELDWDEFDFGLERVFIDIEIPEWLAEEKGMI